jgi:hypothetical protein
MKTLSAIFTAIAVLGIAPLMAEETTFIAEMTGVT